MRRTLVVVLFALPMVLTSASVAFASPLADVLALVPQALSDVMISFTDWSQIKSDLGMGFLTSEHPEAFRLELLRRVSQDHAAASAYALAYSRIHAETWGWDSADLEWEANVVSSELPPTYILKLRDDFDFSAVAVRFAEREFIQTESRGALVYSHELDPSAEWIRTTELSILTTAYLEEEKMMILSSYPAPIEIILALRAGEFAALAEDPFTTTAVEHLDRPASAIIMCGLGECLRFTPNPILDLIGTAPTEGDIAELRAMVEEKQLLVPYRTLGVGYRKKESRPVGTIVFEYDAPELAEADLTARCILAEEGVSSHYDAPIAESYFTVLDCNVQDSAVILEVAPINDQPSRLFRMILYRDAPFAGCSS